MRTSKLKYEIDAMKLKHNYELQMNKMKQELELKQLIDTCKHVYDDNSSARTWQGMQHNGYEACDICGKIM